MSPSTEQSLISEFSSASPTRPPTYTIRPVSTADASSFKDANDEQSVTVVSEIEPAKSARRTLSIKFASHTYEQVSLKVRLLIVAPLHTPNKGIDVLK